eukprot:9036930-Ditylum_brightwellii.AAC.1
MGKDRLGFTADEVGTHSDRSAADMAIKQVQDFTKGISSKMLISPNYFTIPNTTSGHEDPRTRGDMNNFTARQNGGNLAHCPTILDNKILHQMLISL